MDYINSFPEKNERDRARVPQLNKAFWNMIKYKRTRQASLFGRIRLALGARSVGEFFDRALVLRRHTVAMRARARQVGLEQLLAVGFAREMRGQLNAAGGWRGDHADQRLRSRGRRRWRLAHV